MRKMAGASAVFALVVVAACGAGEQENGTAGPPTGPGIDAVAVAPDAVLVTITTALFGRLDVHVERMRDDEAGFHEVKVFRKGEGSVGHAAAWLDEGLEPGARYYYRAHVETESGESAPKDTEAVDMPDAPPDAVWGTASMTLCETPHTAVPDCGDPEYAVDLVFDSSGVGHACFLVSSVRYARFEDNEWTVTTPPGTGANAYSFDCAIILDSMEQPHLIYSGVADGTFGHAWLAGGEWKVETVKSQFGMNRTDPLAAAMDSQDRIHVASITMSSGPFGSQLGLRYFRSGPDGWTEENLENTGLQYDFQTAIAVDSQDRPHVAYILNDELWYRTKTGDGVDWPAERIAVALARDPDLTVDASDSVHVSYFDAQSNTLKWASRAPGDAKFTSHPVSAGGGSWSHQQTRILTDSGGRLYIGSAAGLATRDGDAWQSEVLPHAAYGPEISMALDPERRMHLLYFGEALDPPRLDPGDGTTRTKIKPLVVHATHEEGIRPLVDVQLGKSYMEPFFADIFLTRDAQAQIHLAQGDPLDETAIYRILVDDSFYVFGLPDAVPQPDDSDPDLGLPPWVVNLLFGDTLYRYDGLAWTFMDLRLVGLNWDNGYLEHVIPGTTAALATDGSGLPHLLYFDSQQVLRYAHLTGVIELTHEVVGDGSLTGSYCSLAAAADGTLHAAWIGEEGAGLHYARRTADGKWSHEQVDGDEVLRFMGETSIALDSKERPGITYNTCVHPEPGYCNDPDSLRLARFDGSKWNVESVDSRGVTGGHSALAFGPDDSPHITWQNVDLNGLRYGHLEKGRWVIEDVNAHALNGNRQYSGHYSRVTVDQDRTVRVFRMLTGKNEYAHIPLGLYMGLRRTK